MFFYSFLPLATIAYMIFCIVKGTDLFCRIIAAFYLWSSAFHLLMYNNFLPGFLRDSMDVLDYIHLFATVLFIIQLFRTASAVRARGEDGAKYNTLFAVALCAVVLFRFIDVTMIDGNLFYSLRMRYWPNFLLVGTFIAMKSKKIMLNKDEDRLLLYVSVSALLVLFGFF